MSNKYYLNQHNGNTKTEARGTNKTGKKTQGSASFKEATTNNIVKRS